jgi:hypothetical protein
MEPGLQLTRLSGKCDQGDCPAGYVSNRNTVVFQGLAVADAKGLRLGEGEQAVELPLDIVKETARALGW